MARWRCGRKGCGAVYRLRLLQCPRCHGPELEEESMAKITRTAGPSNASDKPADAPAAEVPDPEPAEVPAAPEPEPADVVEEPADESGAEPPAGRRRPARPAPEEPQA